MTIWLTIIGMALVTYLTRAPGLLAMRGEIAPWLQRWLGFVPIAVFTALILPQLLTRNEGEQAVLNIGPALPAGIVGGLIAWRTGNLLLVIAAGLVTFWVLRWLGL